MEEGRGNIYEEMDCINANTLTEVTVETGFSQINAPPYDQFNSNNTNIIHQMAHQPSNWDNYGYQDSFNFVSNSATTTTPDFLSLLHLPICSLPPPPLPSHYSSSSMLPNSSISLSDIVSSSSAAATTVMYDPLFHLNFPMQPRVEDHIQMDANGGLNLMYDEFDNGILEFNNGGSKRKGRGSRKSRTFPSERERRVHFNDRFIDLKKLIPNSTKSDRASIVGEAIEYIKELSRTIEEFKILMERKRIGKFRCKKKARACGEEEEEEDTVSYKSQSEVDQSSFNQNNSIRCSWLKRKSKFSEVDVRIIDDEVTIKIVQKKKINCLLSTAKVLDQLQLDLHHVGGGKIGEYYSFLFNTKICEGSCVYASGIADTVMEVVEKQYVEAVPTNSY